MNFPAVTQRRFQVLQVVGDNGPANGDGLNLQTIANRGVKIYPGGFPDTFTVDHWRCRFVAEAGEGSPATHAQINSLLQRFDNAGLDVIKTENLYNFDGLKGYSA